MAGERSCLNYSVYVSFTTILQSNRQKKHSLLQALLNHPDLHPERRCRYYVNYVVILQSSTRFKRKSYDRQFSLHALPQSNVRIGYMPCNKRIICHPALTVVVERVASELNTMLKSWTLAMVVLKLLSS